MLTSGVQCMRMQESMPIETEAVNENDLSNTAATLGSNQPQYPLIPYDEQVRRENV